MESPDTIQLSPNLFVGLWVGLHLQKFNLHWPVVSINDQALSILRANTIDISEWLDFDFFERVWYWDQTKMDMTEEQACIGRLLGISHRVGSDMTYWILTESGHVIARSTVQHITVSNTATNEMKKRVQTFDSNLTERLANDDFAVHLPEHVFHL
jgi:hypothetical protein